jgi:hypothetical protein
MVTERVFRGHHFTMRLRGARVFNSWSADGPKRGTGPPTRSICNDYGGRPGLVVFESYEAL